LVGLTVQTVLGAILANAARDPSHCAIAFGGARLSYGGLAERAAVLGAGIGVRDGVVLIFLPQDADAIATFVGVMWAGAVPSFMPLPSAKQEPTRYWSSHRALLETIAPAALVTTKTHAAAMRANALDTLVPKIVAIEDLLAAAPLTRAEAAPRDVVLLQHSSGTTALKKGVALGDAAICAQVEAYAAALKADARDVVASWLPLYHDMGLIAGTLLPLMLGQTIALLDPFKWVGKPGTLFEAIRAERATLCWLPNFAFAHLVRTVSPDTKKYDLSSMRAFVNCSEPCKPATMDAFAARFAPIGAKPEMLQASYAMAETVFAVTQTPVGRAPRVVERDGMRLMSSGASLGGVTLTVEDENGAALRDGAVGEFMVRAPFLFSGYNKRADLTAEKLSGGTYRTNDLGFIQDGEAYVLGRKDDLLIIHGRNYFAHEIEAVAAGVEGVKPGRVVAIGVYSEAVGSEDLLVIAEVDDAMSDEARRAFKPRLRGEILQALGADARDVHLVPPGWLVKTTSGKIARRENKAKYLKEIST
jgi:acyl-CoA synthetase (AMP-forming)/AMP-acid ligase II